MQLQGLQRIFWKERPKNLYLFILHFLKLSFKLTPARDNGVTPPDVPVDSKWRRPFRSFDFVSSFRLIQYLLSRVENPPQPTLIRS